MRISISAIPVAVLVLSFSTAFADGPAGDCGPAVRLDSPGGTMEHVPVVDQGDFGICYSASASEMVDAYRTSHDQAQFQFRSSMIEGAIGSGHDLKNTVKFALDDGGGEACDVAAYYKKQGSCDASVLDANGGELRGDMTFLAKSYDMQDENTPDDCGKLPKKQYGPDEIHGLLASASCTEQEAQDERLANTSEELLAVLASVSRDAEKRIVASFEQACGRARQAAGFSTCQSSKELRVTDAAKTRDFVSGYLTSNTVQPLGIGYCSGVLLGGAKYAGLAADGKGVNGEVCDCNSHESVIIGKRADPKSGKCQFLVQNSWGTDCDGYSSDWTCDHGKIWVDADVLSRNIEDYSYLK